MLKIFLSSHGRFASGIQNSCEILLGPASNLTVFDAYLDDSSVQEHLNAFFEQVSPEDEVLLLSDLYGGSVNQVMYTYLNRPRVRLVAGVNMAFVMSVLCEQEGLTDERLQEILEESRGLMRLVSLEEDTEPIDAGEDFF